jgi:uncharacterized membrane protein YgdD (TMEM256/DUF423 family)
MVLGALCGAGAVGMAAAAAHALAGRLDAKGLEAVRSAVQMQGWHALALVLTGLWVMHARPLSHLLGNLAAAGFAVGMLLFCGAIYANHLGGVNPGPVAPVGGVLLMVGWVLLAASALASGPTL